MSFVFNLKVPEGPASLGGSLPSNISDILNPIPVPTPNSIQPIPAPTPNSPPPALINISVGPNRENLVMKPVPNPPEQQAHVPKIENHDAQANCGNPAQLPHNPPTDEQPHNPVEDPVKLEHDAKLQWKKLKHLPDKMYAGCAVVIGDSIYFGGGIASSVERETTISKYNISNNTWKDLSRISRCKCTLVEYRQKLVAVGGMNKDKKGTTYCRDIMYLNEREQWKVFPSEMKETRMQCMVIAYNDHIIVAGGSHIKMLDSIEIFDGHNWRKLKNTKLPFPMCSATSVAMNGFWYIVGGETPNGNVKSVYRINLESLLSCREEILWNPLASLEYERASIVAFKNRLIAVGGIDYLTNEKIYKHSFGDTGWVEVPNPLPESCYGVAAVNYKNEKLFVIGGCGRVFSYNHVFEGSVV